MKKAKMFLSAIALVAVVSGAFAFKAHKSFGSVVFTTGSAVAATNEVDDFTITNDPQAPGAVQTYATDVFNATAALTYIAPKQ